MEPCPDCEWRSEFPECHVEYSRGGCKFMREKYNIWFDEDAGELKWELKPKVGYMPKSKSDKWATPKKFYDKLNDEFKFTFDPCPITWKEGDADGLSIDWGTSNFVNPPYSNVAKWIEKSYNEWKKGKKVVMLINAVTDTKAFHKYIVGNAEVRFIEGRLKFINPENPEKSAPNVKPSILVIFK